MKKEICPICKVNELLEEGLNALSRKDNETEICSECGVNEAMDELEDNGRGERAYEESIRRKPNYPDGTPRKKWAELSALSRWSWER